MEYYNHNDFRYYCVVGYGDLFPSTLGGRISEAISAIMGSFVLCFMILSLF